MNMELEPLECCFSGCNKLADEQKGWFDNYCFCTEHTKIILDNYTQYLNTGSSPKLDFKN